MPRALLALLLASPLAISCSAHRDDFYFFGFATVDSDKTLCLQLVSKEKDLPTAEGYFCYPVTDEAYARIAAHVGPIEIGEEKPIEPFPD